MNEALLLLHSIFLLDNTNIFHISLVFLCSPLNDLFVIANPSYNGVAAYETFAETVAPVRTSVCDSFHFFSPFFERSFRGISRCFPNVLCFRLCVRVSFQAGSNSLTPLTPISMQEVKSLVNSGASLIETSPNPHSYHPGTRPTQPISLTTH